MCALRAYLGMRPRWDPDFLMHFWKVFSQQVTRSHVKLIEATLDLDEVIRPDKDGRMAALSQSGLTAVSQRAKEPFFHVFPANDKKLAWLLIGSSHADFYDQHCIAIWHMADQKWARTRVDNCWNLVAQVFPLVVRARLTICSSVHLLSQQGERFVSTHLQGWLRMLGDPDFGHCFDAKVLCCNGWGGRVRALDRLNQSSHQRNVCSHMPQRLGELFP